MREKIKKTKTYAIEMTINGELKESEVSTSETLLHALREKFGHVEVKEGCGKGDCGACAVLLNGKAVNACLTLALQAHRQEVMTLKGVGTPENPHPLQQSFVNHGAIQCGFCTPGMILGAYAFLLKNPKPTRVQIIQHMDDHLCRCGAHVRIVAAVDTAAASMKGGAR